MTNHLTALSMLLLLLAGCGSRPDTDGNSDGGAASPSDVSAKPNEGPLRPLLTITPDTLLRGPAVFTPNGKKLVVVADKSVNAGKHLQVFDLETGKSTQQVDLLLADGKEFGYDPRLAVSPDGTLVSAAYGENIVICDVVKGTLVRQINETELGKPLTYMSAFSEDGECILFCAVDYNQVKRRIVSLNIESAESTVIYDMTEDDFETKCFVLLKSRNTIAMGGNRRSDSNGQVLLVDQSSEEVRRIDLGKSTFVEQISASRDEKSLCLWVQQFGDDAFQGVILVDIESGKTKAKVKVDRSGFAFLGGGQLAYERWVKNHRDLAVIDSEFEKEVAILDVGKVSVMGIRPSSSFDRLAVVCSSEYRICVFDVSGWSGP